MTRSKLLSPEHEAQVRALKSDFSDGDLLAPFECCLYWKDKNLSWDELPKWVSHFLFEIAANYFESGPLTARWRDPDQKKVTPRAYIELNSKERNSLTPSLDAVAGIRGTQGKKNAWFHRAEHARYPAMRAYIDHHINRARAEGREYTVPTLDGNQVRVLDRRGRVSRDFRHEVGRRFRVGGFGPPWDKSKTVTRRMKTDK